MHTPRRCFVVACLFFFAMSDGLYAQRDKVFPIKGTNATGKIVEKTRDKVVIEVRNANQNFPTNEISRIVYDGEPQSLSRTKDLASQGQFEQAFEEWKKIDAGALTSEDMKQDHIFYRGLILGALALRGKGDPNTPIGILNNWARDNKTSPLFYSAAEQLGNLALALGKADQAARYYGALVESPFPDLKLKGGYYQGKSQLAQKMTKEAKAKFEAVIDAKLSDPVSLRLQKLAKVAMVRCDATEGKIDEAIVSLEKMVDENDSTDGELFSDIYNTMGSILQTANRDEEALLAYLKTDMLYASQPDAHSEALYHLIQLWTKIGDNTRATEYKTRLTKLYPTSAWAKK